MKQIPISKFQATCLAVLHRVKRTGEKVLITKRGLPVAQVVPPPPPPPPRESRYGCMKGTARELGDIVEPVAEKDWEALRG